MDSAFCDPVAAAFDSAMSAELSYIASPLHPILNRSRNTTSGLLRAPYLFDFYIANEAASSGRACYYVRKLLLLST